MCDLIDQAGSRPHHFFRVILRKGDFSGNCWNDLLSYSDREDDG